MTGNRNLFKVLKKYFGVLTNEKCKEFAFVHGIDELRVAVDGKVIEDDAWNKIAMQYGFDCKDAQDPKIAYVRYVDMLEWHLM
ncbi:hypothetical protein Hanom_Chr06g00568561 [Helianthus anomalus]